MPFCPACGAHSSNWQNQGQASSVAEPVAHDALNNHSGGQAIDPKGMNGAPSTSPVPRLPRKK